MSEVTSSTKVSKKRRKTKTEVIDLEAEPPAKKIRIKKASKKTKPSSKKEEEGKENKDREKRKKKRKKTKKEREKKEKIPEEDEEMEVINLATDDLTEADKQAILLAQQELNENNEPVDLRECVSCNDWVSVGDMYFLDMCSHKYCKNCWSKYCATFLKKEKGKEESKYISSI